MTPARNFPPYVAACYVPPRRRTTTAGPENYHSPDSPQGFTMNTPVRPLRSDKCTIRTIGLDLCEVVCGTSRHSVGTYAQIDAGWNVAECIDERTPLAAPDHLTFTVRLTPAQRRELVAVLAGNLVPAFHLLKSSAKFTRTAGTVVLDMLTIRHHDYRAGRIAKHLIEPVALSSCIRNITEALDQ